MHRVSWDQIEPLFTRLLELPESLAVHPDGDRLASASGDGTVRIWDLPTGRAVVTLRGHGSSVSSVAFSPGGETLASCSYDAIVKLWESTEPQQSPTNSAP